MININFEFLNVNPKNKKVSDCTVRAFALAHGISWYESYDILSSYARQECIIIDDADFIDNFLSNRYEYKCFKCDNITITVGEVSKIYNKGIFLITMSGHITCLIDGVIYDTWDPSYRYVWRIWQVRE